MKKERKAKDFLKTPIFKGGIKAMKAFVGENLKYPVSALEEKIEGSVHLKYTVDRSGVVKRVKIVSGIGYGCDEEAIRIVKLMKFIVTKGGKSKLEYHKAISIHFRLPKNKVQNIVSPQQITYSVTTTPSPKNKKPSVAPKTPHVTYSYTIKR